MSINWELCPIIGIFGEFSFIGIFGEFSFLVIVPR